MPPGHAYVGVGSGHATFGGGDVRPTFEQLGGQVGGNNKQRQVERSPRYVE